MDYVVFDFRETKDDIRFLPVRPNGPISFVYKKTIIVSIDHKQCTILNGKERDTTYFDKNITHVDDYNIWSGAEYRRWRGGKLYSNIPFTDRVTLNSFSIEKDYYNVFYLHDLDLYIHLFTIKGVNMYDTEILSSVHEFLKLGVRVLRDLGKYINEFTLYDTQNSIRQTLNGGVQKYNNNSEFRGKNAHLVVSFHEAIDKLLKVENRNANMKTVYYDIQPIKRVVYQPVEEFTNVEDEPISTSLKPELGVVVPDPEDVVYESDEPKTSLKIRPPVFNIWSQITQVYEFYPYLRWSNYARLGSFKVSYFNSYNTVFSPGPDDHRISHIGVIPYIVSPTGIDYLVTYKKDFHRFCGSCAGDIGGGVKARTSLVHGLHKEISEELSASKSQHTQQLKDHIMEELEKTNRLTTVRYSKYKSTIPFGIMYISDSYFNHEGTRHTLNEDQDHKYKVYYILMLVPIDGRYVNLTQINEAIKLDSDTEIDRVEIMSERQFLDVMTYGKLDTDYNMAFQMLKNIGFTGIHHNCNSTYQDLCEKVRSQMLTVKQWYPYFQKYSNSEIDTRIQNSDYTRLCYLSQKLDLIELMKP